MGSCARFLECRAEAGVNRGRRAVRINGELNRGKRCDVMWVLPQYSTYIRT